MAVRQRMTVEQYLALPEGEKPYREYVDGEVLTKAMPNEDHILLVDELAYAIHAYRRVQGGISGPEPRVRFDTERGPAYRLPDYAYWSPNKKRGDGGQLLPPTLAVEVRSPDEEMEAQREKCRWFRRYGVEVCWLIDPTSRTVQVFEANREPAVLRDDSVLTSSHLPGFELPLAALFRALDRA